MVQDLALTLFMARVATADDTHHTTAADNSAGLTHASNGRADFHDF
jgi:hypothetical protein